MQSELLLYPLLSHILWVVALYTLLTVFRAPAVWNIGSARKNDSRWKSLESKISANLSNQFEWPVLFYLICILIMSTHQSINPLYIWLAWVFVFGRLLHSAVQVLTGNIRLRGVVFTINFLAVLAMWFFYFVDNAWDNFSVQLWSRNCINSFYLTVWL